MTDFTAIVLAGGKGTRLRSIVADRPKVLARVGGRPFLTYLLDQLKAAGARRVVLSTGHLAEQFADEIGDDYLGLPIAYAHEESPLGTGGAIRFAGQLVESEHLIAMNGDSYFDADLRKFMELHLENGSDASLLLARVPDASRYGAVELDEDERVVAFLEKRSDLGPGLINAGVYALRRELLKRLPEGPSSFEKDVMPVWLRELHVRGAAVETPFIDIGVPEDYRRSHEFMERITRG
ncbi:MAG: nucleotidyltransferase family protein [Planctomycetota bacterium]